MLREIVQCAAQQGVKLCKTKYTPLWPYYKESHAITNSVFLAETASVPHTRYWKPCFEILLHVEMIAAQNCFLLDACSCCEFSPSTTSWRFSNGFRSGGHWRILNSLSCCHKMEKICAWPCCRQRYTRLVAQSVPRNHSSHHYTTTSNLKCWYVISCCW